MSIITLTGPSGAGKSTIERELKALGCINAVSHTTRLPRNGEIDGEHYFFINDDGFLLMDQQNAFVEKIDLGTRKYGMSKAQIKACADSGKHTAIVVDPHGATQIREYCRRQGIPVFSVWVDCGVHEQCSRFVQRMANDIIDAQDLLAVCATYAERLELMMNKETIWRRLAYDNKIADGHSYDLKLINDSRQHPEALAANILSCLPR